MDMIFNPEESAILMDLGRSNLKTANHSGIHPHKPEKQPKGCL
jgi:hypothetical protein